MPISFRQLRIGERLLLEPIEDPPWHPVKVRVSSVSKREIVVTFQHRRDRPPIAAGQKVRVSAASGAWVVQASVTTPPLCGTASFTISVDEVERRAHERVKLQTPLRITTLGARPIEFIALSDELSLGGVHFEATSAPAIGAELSIVLTLDTGRSLCLRAVVVSCRDSARKSGRFLVGARFLGLPPLPQLVLKRFLHEKGRELDRD